MCERRHWASEPCPEVGDESEQSQEQGAESDAGGRDGGRGVVSEQGVAESSTGPDSEGVSKKEPLKNSGGCSECGANTALFEDAEKWRRYRNKRRLYMRKKRSEK